MKSGEKPRNARVRKDMTREAVAKQISVSLLCTTECYTVKIMQECCDFCSGKSRIPLKFLSES